MKRPERAYTLSLTIGADTRDDLVRALHRMAEDVARNQISNGCWGSPSDGGHYKLVVDESMTHDRYFELMDDYLDRPRTRIE